MRLFIDTEFIEDGTTIQLLSIAVAAEDGREYYAQPDHFSAKNPYPLGEDDYGWIIRPNDFVARHVLPNLEHFDVGKRVRSCGVSHIEHGRVVDSRCTKPKCPWRTPEELHKELVSFCSWTDGEPDPPEFWGYYAAYDWVALCQIFGDMSALPDGWPMYCHDYRAYLDEHGRQHIKQADGYPHHAMADARWLRESFVTTKIADMLAVDS